MTDYYEDPPPEVPKPPGPGRIVAAGVVGALVLGAGLGLWARPAPQPQQIQARSMAPEDAPRAALQIIVDDDPAPIGPLLEVLPGDAFASEAKPLPAPLPPIPEAVAPQRATAGLMKVDDVVAAEPLLVPAVKVEEPKLTAAAKPAPKRKVEKATEEPKVQKAKVEPKPKRENFKVAEAKSEPEKLKAAEAKPKPKKLKVAEAKPSKPEAAKAVKEAKLAQIEKAKAEKRTMAEKLAKAEKAKAAKLAQAEAKKQNATKAQAETRRLATLVKAVKAAPKKLKTEVAKKKKKKTELAQAKPAKKPQVQKPKVQKASVKPPVVAKAKPPAPKKLVIPRGEGPMRVARSDACASADPGETAVCSDRRLGARDRQLQQAYRNAEAAGVPATALRRQQDRWLQARAAAAREAPWAVEDVYEARISELNDLTRDAREN